MSITPSLVCSRTSGVAPLGIVFDTSATTGTATSYPFHELFYIWDFGERGLGNWALTGKPKHMDIGPIAAHVYETPGTYTVTLTVYDTTGDHVRVTSTIVVTDPNVVFSGADTICVNKVGDSDFTGAPSGSTHQNTDTWATIIGYCTAGKRVLLKRGSVWTTAAQGYIDNIGPGILGAYGTGADPVINTTDILLQLANSTPNPHCSDWRFMDFDVQGDGGGGETVFMEEGTTDFITILRVDIDQCGCSFQTSQSKLDYYNNTDTNPLHHGHVAPVGWVVQECNTTNCSGTMLYGMAKKFAYLGNIFDTCLPPAGEHTFRLMWCQECVIAHNKMRNPQPSKHCITIRGEQWDGGPTWGSGELSYHKYTENIWVFDNILDCVGNHVDWACKIAPTGYNYDTRIRNVIIDGNLVIAGIRDVTNNGTQVGFMIQTQSYVTIRNNIGLWLCSGWSQSCDFIYVQRCGDPPAPTPDYTWAYNNTVYYAGTYTVNMVVFYAETTHGFARNNIICAPAGTPASCSGAGSYTQSNNRAITSNPGWATFPPTVAEDVALAAGSASRDAGYAVPVFSDFRRYLRDFAVSPDQGAFEYDNAGWEIPLDDVGSKLVLGILR